MIEGLDLVVQSMYKNELAIISIKVIQQTARYHTKTKSIEDKTKSLRFEQNLKYHFQPPLAYGDLGRKPDIPGDSRITYLFGLLHFEKQKEMAEMTWAQVQNVLLPKNGQPHLIFVTDYVLRRKNLLCGDFLSWRKMTMRMKKMMMGWREFG